MGKHKSAVIIGNNPDAIQAALYLADVGIAVNLITEVPTFTDYGIDADGRRSFWSTLLKAVRHPAIEFFYNTNSISVEKVKGSFLINLAQKHTYINTELCTGCKKCVDNCSTKLSLSQDGKIITRHAVHKPFPGSKSVPSAVQLEKNQIAPCRAACPLGVNVQGFVALLAGGKTAEAYDLINSIAPLGGILGRLCKHPCEEKCSRVKIDSPLSIRALHRYTYDNAEETPVNSVHDSAVKGKVAIIGSGPAGLMAAWELKRRGYEPTIFESHSTYGGMLATGIPRFRLSREIRERDIKKLLDTGIKIRTGITVGRDIDFAYLKERGYGACFLAIGAMRNSRLNIPGEELEGVIDCMSFLITLNQMNDIFVGSNIVVIGDGNTAVDSARVAVRTNKGSVKILSWTISQELTANRDEFEEAMQEGVQVEFSAFPVEILGDGKRVTGVRCRRTRLTDDIMRNGWHRPEPIPDTDFVIDADHVITAIGQSADATQLNLEGLALDKPHGTISVNPLTLETSIKGIFAGGDCMRGPNNVVDAMADGKRAAESIDRYLSGRDLEKGRQAETPKIAEVDLNSIIVSPAARADITYLDIENRRNTYEETTWGLSPDQTLQEAGRCLSCALCSECMECVKVCRAGAIVHEGIKTNGGITADVVWKFPAGDIYLNSPQIEAAAASGVPGIYDFTAMDDSDNLKGLAAILSTVLDKDTGFISKPNITFSVEAGKPGRTSASPMKLQEKCGVFLCRCNGNNNSIIDFTRISNSISSAAGIKLVAEIEQACCENGAASIMSQATAEGLERIVIAACRCCNHDQPCYSCNDRRILCQKHLSGETAKRDNCDIDYVNIRELCAWPYKNDPAMATENAERMIHAATAHPRPVHHTRAVSYPIRQAVLSIGNSAISKTAAKTLEALGYEVRRVYPPVPDRKAGSPSTGQPRNHSFPDSIEIGGQPGNYEVKLDYGKEKEVFNTGAIIVDASLSQNELKMLALTYTGRLLGRLLALPSTADNENHLMHAKYEQALNQSGLFISQRNNKQYKADSREGGILLAAEILLYLHSKRICVPPERAVTNSSLCRGCRRCADQCLLIEMRETDKGQLQSYVEQHLCTGCGDCAGVCPTAAIGLNPQGTDATSASLRSILCKVTG